MIYTNEKFQTGSIHKQAQHSHSGFKFLRERQKERLFSSAKNLTKPCAIWWQEDAIVHAFERCETNTNLLYLNFA